MIIGLYLTPEKLIYVNTDHIVSFGDIPNSEPTRTRVRLSDGRDIEVSEPAKDLFDYLRRWQK